MGHLDLATLLVERGADVHKEDNRGETPLAAASRFAFPVAVQKALAAVVEMLDAWRALTAVQRRVIVQHGRPYFEMLAWEEGRHREYPAHLRGQAVTLVLCSQLGSEGFPFMPGHVLSVLVGAVDARNAAAEGRPAAEAWEQGWGA